jgi:putative pyruvate formate lyase activating enzyme
MLKMIKKPHFRGGNPMRSQPLSLHAAESGLLRKNAEKAIDVLRNCMLCPRRCGVDRLSGEMGMCRIGRSAVVASYGPHFGEEAPLVGEGGSGNIFFSGCNLLCNFCQNFDISHSVVGEMVTVSRLAGIMLSVQEMGCHNINLVTPSHIVPQILEALERAVEKGLKLPVVYNSSGYDSVETLQLLDGIVDIYMPDFKFWDNRVAQNTCGVGDYRERACEALAEMHRQVGDLVLDENGLAVSGLLVRHLVMPNGLAGTREVMRFLAEEISPDTYVNVMDQYRPCGMALENERLNQAVTRVEYDEAMRAAREEGIHRFDRPRRYSIF